MMELCQGVLDGKEISDDWQISVLVLFFKEKENVSLQYIQRSEAVRTCYEGC